MGDPSCAELVRRAKQIQSDIEASNDVFGFDKDTETCQDEVAEGAKDVGKENKEERNVMLNLR